MTNERFEELVYNFLAYEPDEDTPNIYTGALKVMAVENLLMRTGKEKKLEKTFPHDEERVDD